MKARYTDLIKKALPLAAMLCSAASALHAAGKVDPAFAKVVQPFIENHCMDCHDADSARAGIRLDTLGNGKRGHGNGVTRKRGQATKTK